MSRRSTLKPIAAAIGTTFAVSLAAAPLANAAENPFSMTQFSNGYMVAEHGGEKGAEGKCGEGKCGEKRKAHEGKCGEGKCGEGKKAEGDEQSEGRSGGEMKGEGKCGEGKCGASLSSE
ncbi:MAG: hypothetical protein L0Z68_08465 [Gammaproteobacteria bacterium]|nr:hypothetical protein [Gammaproteobacteria bacterium]